MKKRLWVSLACFFATAAFLLLSTPADSPSLLAQEGIRPASSIAPSSAIGEAGKARLASAYGKLPLSFEPNQGQTGKRIKFLSRGRGYALFLTSNEAILGLKSPTQEAATKGLKDGTGRQPAKPDVLRMKLAGANQNPQVTGLNELPGKSNYLIGKDAAKWRVNVPNYAKVRYQNVYPGIDLVYYGNQQQLEYDFVVAPGADLKAISLEIAGTDRTSPATLGANGDLVIKTEAGEVRFHKPVVFQAENAGPTTANRKTIDGRFVLLAKNRIGFEVPSYDAAKPLYIDPVISYGTYLGFQSGGGWDAANGIAVDSSGNACVTGMTFSTDFPTTPGAYDSTCGTDSFCNWDGTYSSSDAFVTKLNADGSSLVYSTYLGGSGHEAGLWIAVDSAGNAYVAGETSSDDFPTTENAYQKTWGGGTCNLNMGAIPGCRDAFVVKLNATGSDLLYSTYLGGSSDDYPMFNGIGIDAAGNAYVAGVTQSSDFPTVNAIQSAIHEGTCGPAGNTFTCPDGFVAKINPAAVGAASLVYSTYLGGSGPEQIRSVAVDGDGNAYVAGQTQSPDFPTTAGAFQTSLTGPANAFVAKINSTGSAFAYSTFLGGAGWDQAASVAVDGNGNAYVTGMTNSVNFPTTEGAFDTDCGTDGQCNGMSDTFVTKVKADGSNLVYSTYLGGSRQEAPFSIAVDSLGIAYVTGWTNSADFPEAGWHSGPRPGTCGPSGNTHPCMDAYVSKLSAGGEGLIVSGYLAGSDDDIGNGIAIDASRDAYVAGQTASMDFPTTSGAYQETSPGSVHAFVTKLSDLALHQEIISPESLDFGGQLVGTTSEQMTVTVKNIGDAPTPIPPLDATGDFQFTQTCGSSIAPGTSCTIDVTFTPQETGTRTGAVRSYDQGSDQWYPFVSLTGQGQDFGLAARTDSVTVSPGETADFDLLLSPEGGFNQTVDLACSGAPQGSTCTVTPASVTLDGSNNTSVGLKVTTTGNALLAPGNPGNTPPPSGGLPMAGWLAIFGLLAIAALAKFSPQGGRAARLAPFATLALLAMLAVACGGGSSSSSTTSSGTPAGTYTLSVTATVGGVTHGTGVTLIVK